MRRRGYSSLLRHRGPAVFRMTPAQPAGRYGIDCPIGERAEEPVRPCLLLLLLPPIIPVRARLKKRRAMVDGERRDGRSFRQQEKHWVIDWVIRIAISISSGYETESDGAQGHWHAPCDHVH